jgi:hypothetical protein
MTDSYTSSAHDGDYSNGVPDGSSPSLTQPQTGLSSVIRKKLMGYVGFANLPNQVHRKSVRKGFQFTAMVVGGLASLFLFPGVFFTLSFRGVGLGQVYPHQHLVQYHPLSC